MEEMNWGTTPEPISEITTAKLDQLSMEYAEARRAVDDIKAAQAEIQSKLEERERALLAALEAAGKTSWECAAGRIGRQTRTAVTTPKEPEAREAFFNYLKEKGAFDALITVNYQTLNAFYNAEEERALSEGNVNFSIPGIGAPTVSQFLKLTRKK